MPKAGQKEKISVEVVGAPTKGVRPNFTGVAGQLISTAELPVGLEFGSKATRVSPYDPLLKQLLEAGPASCLCFGEYRAKTSVVVRARKLNMKIETGEHLGKLYVRLCRAASVAAPVDETVSVGASQKTRRRSLIIAAIKSGRHTPESISAHVREQDGSMVDGSIMRSMLKQMEKDGSVILAKVTPETWNLTEVFN